MRAKKSGHGMEGLECWLPLCASEEIQGLERHAFHQVPLVVHGGRLAEPLGNIQSEGWGLGFEPRRPGWIHAPDHCLLLLAEKGPFCARLWA